MLHHKPLIIFSVCENKAPTGLTLVHGACGLTVLQAHPQLFVVFLLHVVDDLALVLEGIGLFDAGHEVSLHHRAGWTVEQVTIWEILIQTQAFSLRAATSQLPKGQRNVKSCLCS